MPRIFEMEVWLTSYKYASPASYHAQVSRSGSDGTSVIMEIRLKNVTPCVPLLKVTQGHQNRPGSIGYL